MTPLRAITEAGTDGHAPAYSAYASTVREYALQEKGANRDFSFIIKQNGMFSFSGLTKRSGAASA